MLRFLLVMLLSLPLAFVQAGAQSITGYSSIQDTVYCPPIVGHCSLRKVCSYAEPPSPSFVGSSCSYGSDGTVTGGIPQAKVYSDTEEDYTASLYYNVETENGVYYEDSSTPISSQDLPGNPSISLAYTYIYPANGDGIYSENTAHLLDFFYVTSIGEYYDPFGYSATNGEGDGNYDSGFWFYVDAYGQYITEASVLLGETYSVINHNSPGSGNPSTPSAKNYSVVMQTFIPGNNAEAPYKPFPLSSLPSCGPERYAGFPLGYFEGDSRGSNPNLGSYRSFQQIMLGLGGSVPLGGGVQDTGYTHLFDADAIANGIISQAALADTVQGDCHYLIAQGKADTKSMIRPQASGQGGSSVSTTLQGSTGNPLAPSGAIQWNAQVTLTQTSPTTVNVTGTMFHKCFPAYELSIGGTDVDYQPPANSDFSTIFTCLAGFGAVTDPINRQIIVAP